MRTDLQATDFIPRFPAIAPDAGHYESYYLTAHEPGEPNGIWIRYTVRQAPGAEPTGSLWFTRFTANGPWATKTTTAALTPGEGGTGIAIGGSTLSTTAADGEANDASWNLALHSLDEPLEHLPRAWMYRGSWPRTKATSQSPRLTLTGTVTVAGEQIDVTGWHGMLGHNWGVAHADRWIWLHGSDFDEDPTGWLDVVIGRVPAGPIVLPWIAQGMVSIGGERIRLGGMSRMVSTDVEDRPDGCTVTLRGAGVRVAIAAAAQRHRFVGWEYADPDGTVHQVRNCSVAEVRVHVDDRVLTSRSGGAYELGTREVDPTLRIADFPDS